MGYRKSSRELIQDLKQTGDGLVYESLSLVKLILTEPYHDLLVGQVGYSDDYVGDEWFFWPQGAPAGLRVPKRCARVLARHVCGRC